MSFTKRFQTSLESLPRPEHGKQYVVAYSGGVDSQVLLFCLKKINVKIRAVHVHHGLQTVADEWVKHCQHSCEQLDIPLAVLYVDAAKKSGESPEQSARNARYQALQKNLNAGEFLVTAQHLNDQAETLLLQLFRTASSAGLAAMPASKEFGEGLHIRPLLNFSRQSIEKFANDKNLQWVEDPSNQDIAYDRNFLRSNILPLLETRWPELTGQLATVANLQSNNLQVLEDMAAIDLAHVLRTQKNPEQFCVFDVCSMLSINALQTLSSSRLLNLLRYWIKTTLNMQPTRKLLHEIEKSLLLSQTDANPEINFSRYSFKKYQGNLYLLVNKKHSTPTDYLPWQPASVLQLPDLNMQIKIQQVAGAGLDKKLLSETLKIGFRKGGEKFHPFGRRHSQSLKKLLQEANVPPWERDILPLIYLGDELIAVGGLWISKHFAVEGGGWRVVVFS